MHPHEYFISNKICNIISENINDKYNSVMKMKCNWIKYVDETNQANLNKIIKTSRNGHAYTYEILFEPSAVPSDILKYKILNKNLFKNIRLKSLSFQNLGLIMIEKDAFNQFCCENSLEMLDLSKNHLTRIDLEVLENLKRLTKLNLAYNDLSLSEHNFENNKNLQNLDLSFNNIQYLPFQLLNGLNELEIVSNFFGIF